MIEQKENELKLQLYSKAYKQIDRQRIKGQPDDTHIAHITKIAHKHIQTHTQTHTHSLTLTHTHTESLERHFCATKFGAESFHIFTPINNRGN